MIENHVVCLELAKKLKEMGYPQGRSCFVYAYNDKCEDIKRSDEVPCGDNLEYCDAPLFTEIIELIPESLEDGKDNTYYRNLATGNFEYRRYEQYDGESYLHCQEYEENATIQDLAAKTWLFLKENGYIGG